VSKAKPSRPSGRTTQRLNQAHMRKLRLLVEASELLMVDPAIQSMRIWRGDVNAIRYAFKLLNASQKGQ